MDQNQTSTRDRLEMTPNTQGFDIPVGCVMTTAVILIAIIVMSIGLFQII